MKSIACILILACVPGFIHAQQTVNYNDVAVIINDSSEVSLEIGQYFRQQRNIPFQNVIHISATTAEEINYLEFQDIRLQIEDHLISNGLQDSINYIATTKGVPLKVLQNPEDSLCYAQCGSFDSELTLILSDSNGEIGNDNGFSNPYFDSDDHYTRANYGIYLVTRLDGYKKDDVLALIDRSGPNTPVNQMMTNSIFDITYVTDPVALNIFTNSMGAPIDSLTQNGWETTFHPDTALLTNQENVFAFRSISMGPPKGVLNNSWVEGSISEMTFGYSASTFSSNENAGNDILIADLILEGATGAHGYAYETYFGPSIRSNILFSSYIDTVAKYNLAESYYKSMPFTSWHNVVIGDPKTSIFIDNTLSIENVDYSKNVNVFPNPSAGSITITVDNILIQTIDIFNPIGQIVYSESGNVRGENTVIDLSQHPNGIYFIQMNTDKGLIGKKVLISK